jgi:hypothetical protein
MTISNTPNTFYLNTNLNKWVLVLPGDKHLVAYEYLSAHCNDLRVARAKDVAKFLLNNPTQELVAKLNKKYNSPKTQVAQPVAPDTDTFQTVYVPINEYQGYFTMSDIGMGNNFHVIELLGEVTCTYDCDGNQLSTQDNFFDIHDFNGDGMLNVYCLDFTKRTDLYSLVAPFEYTGTVDQQDFLRQVQDALVNQEDANADTQNYEDTRVSNCLVAVENTLKPTVTELMQVPFFLLKDIAKSLGMANTNSARKRNIAKFVWENDSADHLSKMVARATGLK